MESIDNYPVILRVETIKTMEGDTLTSFQLGDKYLVMKHPLDYKEVAYGIEMVTNFYTKSQDKYHEVLIKFGENLIENNV